MSTVHAFALSEADRALLPTDDDVRFYQQHGWWLSSAPLYTEEEVAAFEAAAERYYAGERDRGLPVVPPKIAYWRPEDGDVQRHNDYVHYEFDAFRRLLTKPLIGAVAARLAGVDDIRLFQSTLIRKPPKPDEPSNVVPWHFDRHYWSSCSSEQMLTAFIPFHHCDERMGTITMIDGSHRWRELPTDDSVVRHFAKRDRATLEEMLSRNAEFNGDVVRKVPVVIPQGHVNFHHCRIYHGSGANRGDQPRRAVSLHLQDGANHWRGYPLSDGSVYQYNHDAVVRRTGTGEPDYADPDVCPVIWSGAAA
ncbi:phytanoyl-CoA dioxygenase family protein [Burkholderia perseverans]|uniref:phytanoyl-CoA dioxygenase family protein n=1 Tax=Burkholderia perseverans TaxID=2615214 RepID=UPI001FEEA982|nr:phytanoyl-CoA dioxygenase family protein [Burkholderia perseverans]